MGQRRVNANPRTAAQGGTGLKAVPSDSLLLGAGVAPSTLVSLPAAGQQLRSDGAAWAVKAEGKILQSLTFSDANAHSVASGSFPIWSFGLTLKKSNSKVLVLVAMASARDSTINTWGRYSLYRSTSTPAFGAIVYNFGYPFCYFPLASGSEAVLALPTVDGLWLDSPGVAAGGTVTYTIFLENTGGVGSLQTNWFGNVASTAMLMEVAA